MLIIKKANQNKKGFTLVELLAAMVVLSIIDLIGYSSVGKVIETSKIKAPERSAYNYVDAIELYLMTQEIDGENIGSGTYSISDDIKVKGTKPSSGVYEMSDSNVSKATLCVDNLLISYEQNSGVKHEGACNSTDKVNLFD